MGNNVKIDVMGVLNSIDKDGILAEADQIEIGNYDNGSSVKVPEAVLRCAKAMTANELSSFSAKNTASSTAITGSQLFICASASATAPSWLSGHLYYYDASNKSITDITPATGGGGGSSSGVILTVSFHSTEATTTDEISVPYIWTSSNTGYGTVYYILDDASAGTKRMTPGSAAWSIGKLKRGTHTLSIYVTDSANHASSVWNTTLIVGSLEISTTSALELTSEYGKDISIPYTVYFPNNDGLYLITQIDSNDPVETAIDKTVASGTTKAFVLSGITDSVHTLKMSLRNTRSSGTVETSNSLSFKIIVAKAGKLYASAVESDIEIFDYSILNLVGFVTYLGASSLKAKLSSVIDSATGTAVSGYSLPSSSTWINGTNTMSLSSLPAAGKYVFTITVTYGQATADIVYGVTIKKSDLATKTIVTDGILFSLSASGKSNSNDDRSVWADSAGKLAESDVALSNFNYKSTYDQTTGAESGTGWISDSDGTNSRLLIQSGAYVEINCKPLQNEIENGNGITFDIDFSTEDVLDQEARVVSCYSEGRGFWISTEYATLSNNMTPTETVITATEIPAVTDPTTGALISEAYTKYSRTGPFQSNFKQNERTHVSFVIAKKTSSTDETTGDLNGKYPISSMMIYINGVLTNIMEINDQSIKFANNTKITLGCDNSHAKTGKCEIYHVRAYSRALSSDEILQNYISDFAPETQDSLIKFNSSEESSNSGLPKMTLIFHKADFAVMTKDTKKWCKVIYMVPGDNTKTITGMAQCAWQGTSSLTYAVKNYKIKLYEFKTIDGTDGTTSVITNTKKLSKQKIDIGNGITENVFCLKADYMDSSHARNTGTAMFVSDLDTPQTPPQQMRPQTRSTIYGFPIKLYIQTTESDLYETTGTANYTDPVFYGIYNFNLDKGSNDSLGMITQADMLKYLSTLGQDKVDSMNSQYPNWDCISFEGSANSDSTAGAFVVNPDEMTHNASIASDFELRFEDPGDLGDKTLSESTTTIEQGVDSAGTQYYKITGFNTDVDGYFVADKATNSLVPHSYDPYGSITKSAEATGGYVIKGTLGGANGRMSFARSDGTLVSDDGIVSIAGTYSSTYAFRGTTKDSNGNYTDDGKLSFTISVGTKSDATTGGTVEYLKLSATESNQLRIDRRYSHLKKLIKWVSDHSGSEHLSEFKSDFKKHFDLDAVLDYYCTVLTLLLADNLGKNVMWNTWGPKALVEKDIVASDKTVVAKAYSEQTGYSYTADEISKYDDYIWYPQFYDMDTELGCDNSGNIRFDVDSEMEQGVFNTSGSLLWTTFRKAFASEILEHYKKMRTASADHSSLTYDSLYKYYITNQISKISQSNYNYDMFNKYLNTEAKRGYIFMCHGSQQEFLMRWLEQRLYFLDTYFNIGTDSGISGTVRVEYSDYATVPVTFSIKTYKPAYVKITFFNTASDASEAESGTLFKKVPRDATVTFSKYVKTSTDQEVLIYDAPNIKTFGDVSRYSPKTVMVSTMTHLTELSVGSEDYPNPNLTDLTLGNNSYLTSVKAEYCTAMTSTLSLTSCNNIQTVSTIGSKIPYVSFNPSGCALQKATFGSNTTLVDIENCPLLSSLEFQSMVKLSTLRIVNCPKLLGTAMTNDAKGVFYYNVLNSWKPTSINTEMYLYGFGEMADYTMLDSCSDICASLEKSYVSENPTATSAQFYEYLKKKIYLGGEIDYMGTTIPNRYSVYGKYFPDLTVKYPQVTNVSGMFKNYKNINSISQKIVGTKNSLTGEITYTTVYYWTDPRKDSFPSDAYDSDGNRKLLSYDYIDMNKVADEIKARIDPFQRFTNMDEMFSGDSIIEKILPETFDNITDISGSSTSQMFYNCQNLKYVECPRVNALGNQMFYNCLDTVIYVPDTITDPSQISAYAFQCEQASSGKHQTILFEAPESNFLYDPSSTTRNVRALDPDHCAVDGARDVRFGIRSYSVGNGRRAMLKSSETVIDVLSEMSNGSYVLTTSKAVDLDIYYFNTSVLSGDKASDGSYTPYRLIYDVRNKGDDESTAHSSIVFNNWNLEYVNGTTNWYGNPLHIAEMLRGSMSRFDTSKMFGMAIPTMRTVSLSSNGISEYREEGSIARIFYPNVTTAALQTVGISEESVHFISEGLHVLSVAGWNTTISKFFLAGTSVKIAYVGSGITEIQASAFEDSSLGTLSLDPYDKINGYYNLTKIGDYAFKGTDLSAIFIPNSVTSIGQFAYQNTLMVTDITYSENMTEIPMGCFAGCDSTNAVTCTSIKGFSPTKITSIGNYAFDKASGLKIVQSSISSNYDVPSESEYSDYAKYHCYFACDPKRSRFLDYFENLIYIGDYAFRGVTGIKKITLKQTVKTIGAFAFDPAKTGEYDTMIVWDKDGDFSSMSIGRYAFAGRQFCWYSNGYGGIPITGVFEKTVFIPSAIRTIELDAFSCDTSGIESAGELRYALIDGTYDSIFSSESTKKWNSDFVTHNLRTVYNFYCPYILADKTLGVRSLYFLIKDKTALFARSLDKAVTVVVAPSIKPTDSSDSYIVTEMVDEALKDDTSLNALQFGEASSDNTKGSQVRILGKRLFSSNSTLLTISAYNNGQSGTTLVPATLTTVGEGTPFKTTSWYRNIKYTDGDFLTKLTTNGYVYFNNVLLGYKKTSDTDTMESLAPKEGTDTIYDDAFASETTIKRFSFNKGLAKIGDRAFTGCVSLESVSFSACADTLSYIGTEAFKNCSMLRKITFTKALRHVGTGSIQLTGITEIRFDEGCVLDSTSYAICPTVDSATGYNKTITDLYIPASMGPFFSISSATSTAAEFLKLANVTNLVLGTEKTVSVKATDFVSHLHGMTGFDPSLTVGYIMDDDSQRSDYNHYYINLRHFFPTYYASSEATAYDVLDVSAAADADGNITFMEPDDSAENRYYESELDISKISADSLDNYDMFRLIMAYDPAKTTRVRMSKAQWSLVPTAFNKFKGNRITVETTSN